jgi:hypothetical protein
MAASMRGLADSRLRCIEHGERLDRKIGQCWEASAPG